jgi:predicted Fe-Mo cluster-binding NifX family protein
VKIAIPRFDEVVAPCFEYCATMAIFNVEGTDIVSQIDVPIRSQKAFDRIRLMRDHEVETVICGGVQEIYEDMLNANNINVVSWVSGNVEDLLHSFLQGTLVPGTAKLGQNLKSGKPE